MNQKAILVAVVLFVLIVAGMFVFAFLQREQMQEQQPNTPATATDTTQAAKPAITGINAKHYFDAAGGIHTIAGEIMLPTTCDLLTHNEAMVDDGKKVVVSFDVVNNSTTPCGQATTPARFKIGFKADKDVTIEARFKGELIPLNLIPAAEGENPADFQLFLKG